MTLGPYEHNEYLLLQFQSQRELSVAVHAGRVKRAPCIICGDPNTHGHHHNYHEPYDVWWLCPKHHGWQHRGRGGQRFVGQYQLVTEEPKPPLNTRQSDRVVKRLEAAMFGYAKHRDFYLDAAAIVMVDIWITR